MSTGDSPKSLGELRQLHVAAWKSCSEELGIAMVFPFYLPGDDTPLVHLPEWGGARGMVVVPLCEEANLRPLLRAAGYYFSHVGELYYRYERDLFLETLEDWGYFGPPERRPGWCR